MVLTYCNKQTVPLQCGRYKLRWPIIATHSASLSSSFCFVSPYSLRSTAIDYPVFLRSFHTLSSTSCMIVDFLYILLTNLIYSQRVLREELPKFDLLVSFIMSSTISHLNSSTFRISFLLIRLPPEIFTSILCILGMV